MGQKSDSAQGADGALRREYDSLSLSFLFPPSDLLCLRSSKFKYNVSTINYWLFYSSFSRHFDLKSRKWPWRSFCLSCVLHAWCLCYKQSWFFRAVSANVSPLSYNDAESESHFLSVLFIDLFQLHCRYLFTDVVVTFPLTLLLPFHWRWCYLFTDVVVTFSLGLLPFHWRCCYLFTDVVTFLMTLLLPFHWRCCYPVSYTHLTLPTMAVV